MLVCLFTIFSSQRHFTEKSTGKKAKWPLLCSESKWSSQESWKTKTRKYVEPKCTAGWSISPVKHYSIYYPYIFIINLLSFSELQYQDDSWLKHHHSAVSSGASATCSHHWYCAIFWAMELQHWAASAEQHSWMQTEIHPGDSWVQLWAASSTACLSSQHVSVIKHLGLPSALKGFAHDPHHAESRYQKHLLYFNLNMQDIIHWANHLGNDI